MTEKDNVIKGLECCIESDDKACPRVCPFYKECLTDDLPYMPVIRAALKLLKEQEANKPKIGHWIFESQYYEAWSHTCSECGKRTTTKVNEFANWCWNCGAKMGGEAE